MRGALVPFLLLATLAAPTAAQDGRDLVMPQPEPDADDRWTFDTVLFGDGEVRATATTRMGGVETIDFGDESHHGHRLETAHAGAREGERVVTWHHVPDFATLQVARRGPDGEETIHTPREPCREWRFPMRVGDAWTTRCAFETPEGDAVTRAADWSVVRAERVSVPAGAFDALVLEKKADDGSVERWWFAPEACWWVRHEAADREGNLLAAEALARVEGCPAAAAPATTAPPAPSLPAPAPGTPPSVAPDGTAPPGERTLADRIASPSAALVGGILLAGTILAWRAKRS